MARPKTEQERWIIASEATAILRKNSGRDDIPDSYIRSLVRSGKVDTKQLDGRTVLYNANDVEQIVVQRRDQGKGKRRKPKSP